MIAPAAATRSHAALQAAAELAGPLGACEPEELARALYATWYSGSLGPDGLPRTDPAAPDIAATATQTPLADGGSRDAVSALRAAHAGARTFERGWQARRVSSTGRVVAARGEALRLLDPADYVTLERPGMPPRAGAKVAVVARRDDVDVSPGYWLTLGEGWPADGHPPDLVRLYWNVRGGDAPRLVAALTRALLAGPDRWALKVAADLGHHVRRDAAVVYLPGADADAHAPALAAAAEGLADVLAADEPPLTLRLTPGVGLSEDPPGAESFGEERCALVARGLLDAADDLGDRVEAVEARLRAAGLDPARPHLRVGSTRSYGWPPPGVAAPAPVPTPLVSGSAKTPPSADDDRFRAGAEAIACSLVADAIWFEDRCTWLGDALEPEGGDWVVVHRSCDGDLYGGTAGIGRFLAQWAAWADDAAAARAARGACSHALAWANRQELQRGGLFQGALGVAYAAHDAAALLDDDALGAAAQDLGLAIAAAIAERSLDDDDLLVGEAGAVLGLVALGDALWPDVRAAACAAADRLLARGRVSLGALHWPARTGAEPYGLCGLAHGAAGIALALDALAARTGDPRWHVAGAGALAHERRWYREGHGWPDLRDVPGTDLALGRSLSYPSLWCHGAVGCGLVRLATGRDLAAVAEAGAALQVARRGAAAALRSLDEPGEPAPAANWSLCHGLLGTAELMLCATQRLGEPAHLAAARRLGERGLADRAARGEWRCGVAGGGETPGLLLGLAGIGTTLLRLHDPAAAPSPALPGPALGRGMAMGGAVPSAGE